VANVHSKIGFRSTKFAVEGLSEALALALPKTGVRVTLVEPGATQTAALQRALQMLEEVIGTGQNGQLSNTHASIVKDHPPLGRSCRVSCT
jgi:NAD(P)-dependent dehydrogenase (short-subunit alcohol dehydrogenase family)